MHKNMKIEINEQQPLDEVERELRNRGYHKNNGMSSKIGVCVWAYQDGEFIVWSRNVSKHVKPTTLAELKEM